jgi:hypothetical protein
LRAKAAHVRWLARQLSGIYARRLLAYATELEAEASEAAAESEAKTDDVGRQPLPQQR